MTSPHIKALTDLPAVRVLALVVGGLALAARHTEIKVERNKAGKFFPGRL